MPSPASEGIYVCAPLDNCFVQIVSSWLGPQIQEIIADNQGDDEHRIIDVTIPASAIPIAFCVESIYWTTSVTGMRGSDAS